MLQEGLDVHCELDGISGRLGSEVVLASLESNLPGIEVGSCQLAVGWLCHVDVQTLRLANIRCSSSGQVDECFLRDLPHSLVEQLEVIRKFLDGLHTPVVCNDLVSDVIIPLAKCNQVSHHVRVHADELSCQHSSGVDVGSIWFKGLVVAKDLGSGGCWHGSNEEGVASTILDHILAQAIPVVSGSVRFLVPEVELEESFAQGRTLKGRVRAFNLAQLHAGLHCCVIDSLKDHGIELECLLMFERYLECEEHISQSLNTDANGTMTEVGVLGLDNWIVVPVNDHVQVSCNDLGHLVELCKVIAQLAISLQLLVHIVRQ